MNLDFGFTYRGNPEISISIVNRSSGASTSRFAYIDTGADVTMLDENIAGEIGIALEPWDDSSVRGIGGGRSNVQLAEVELRLLETPALSIALEAVFVPHLEDTVGNLIGLDVLSRFDIALSHGRSSGSIGNTFEGLR